MIVEDIGRELDGVMNEPEFWQDQKKSEETVKEASMLKAKVEPIETIFKSLSDSEELIELANEEGDTTEAYLRTRSRRTKRTKGADEASQG